MFGRPHDQGPLRDLKIAILPICTLKPNPRNARTHPRWQIRQIAKSIDKFGFINPVLIDDRGMIIAGHGRVEAAKLLGVTHVPTVRVSHMSDVDMRAYIIAENKLAENAGWDEAILRIEFQELLEIDPELDLTITGLDIGKIDLLLGDDWAEPDRLDDVVPPNPEALTVTQSGDLWLLGPHRVLCGDATDTAAYTRLLEGEEAQMAFTDPPYNVPIDGHASGLGRVHHGDFRMASGEMTGDEFQGFLTTILGLLIACLADGAIAFVCMDWRHLYELLAAARDTELALKNLIVWAKTNAGMGTFYRSQHELIAAFKVGIGPHINSFGLGQHGRRRTNVWTYPGGNSFGPGRDAALAMHPTVKPVALVADAIKDCSKRNGLILDPFLGSGTTLISAELTGRRAAGCEIDPRYVDTTMRRWQQMTGKHALLAATGEPFNTVAMARATAAVEASHGR
jgi:DNA modification methylase